MPYLKKRFLLGFFLLLMAGFSAYSAYVEPFWLKTVNVDIAIPKDSGILQEIKILHLSDFHPKGQVDERKIIQAAHEINPDLIVLTGDFVESQDMIERVLNFVSRLPNVQTYAVLGNWEHWAKINLKEYRKSLKARSVELLVNQCAAVEVKGQRLVLAGVDDPGTWYDDLPKTLKQCPQKGYRILLSHSPWIMKKLKPGQVSLALAGHCHGGQIKVPFYGPIWLPRGCSREEYYGLYDHEGTPLYVTSGLGTSILPLRLFSRPEVAVIRLQPQSAKG